MKKGPSPMIGQGQQMSQNLNTLGQGQETSAVAGEQAALTNPQSTPLYKAILSQGRQNLSNSYQNAASNTASRARMSGFGYQQPISQAAQTQLGAQEASQAAQLPAQAVQESVPLEEQAYGQMANQGLGEQGLGQNYFKDVVPLEEEYYSPQNQGFWGTFGQGFARSLGNTLGGGNQRK